MYARPPSESELRAFGLTAADYAGDVVTVWPENERAVEIFEFARSQWRHGFAGPTGLDYIAVFRRIDRLGLLPERVEQLESDIRVMEEAALLQMYEDAEDARSRRQS